MEACERVRPLVPYLRPRCPELEASDLAAVRAHLVGCPDCTAAREATRRVDEPLARAVQAVPLPADFQTRLLGRLADGRRRYVRKRALQAGAVAASLAAGVVGWSAWSKPALDLDAMAMVQSERSLSTPEQVAEYFKARGFDVPPADKFEYRQLRDYGMATMPGTAVTVPRLEFVSHGATAHVYAVRDRQFTNLKRLADDARASVSNCTVVLLRAENGWTFVVVVTGGVPPEQFFTVEKPGIA